MTARQSFRSMLAALFLLVLLAVPLVVHAETKILTTEATYTMGDGETPSFAEAMVLQKAKQMALEEAGTYVESYTKVQNLDLTVEEIQTVAGGVMQTEVLEKKRLLVGDGLQIYVKIKATVSTDKMEELAQRIKDKNVAEEYKKLREDYTKLAKELESWKQLVAKTPPGPKREAALDRIREREKAFSALQDSEAVFFRQLVSGEALVKQAEDEKAIVDALFQKLAEQGHRISVGGPTSHRTKDPDKVKLRIPVTLAANRTIRRVMEETARSLGGEVISERFVRWFQGDKRATDAAVIAIGRDIETARYFQERVRSLTLVIKAELKNGEAFACTDWSQNRDQANWAYWETNPIAPVSWLERRFRPSYGELVYKDLVWWVSDHYGLIAGSRDPIHPLRFGDGAMKQDPYGWVVVFEDERSFTVTMLIPVSQAKQIKAIRAEFIDSSMMQAQAIAEQSETQENKIKGEPQSSDSRSWWQQLFQTDQPTSDIGQAAMPSVVQRKNKMMSIACTIEP